MNEALLATYPGESTMGVPAFGKLQSLEEVHRVVFAAVRQRRPIAAVYDGARRLLCPHVLGYNQPGEYRVFCYQYGGESRSGPGPKAGAGIWRCLSLKRLTKVELLHGSWRTEPHARQRCVKNIEIDAEDHADGDLQNGQ